MSGTETQQTVASLWDDYCDASRPIGVLSGGIEEYSIDSMDEAAYALMMYAKLLESRADTRAPIGRDKALEEAFYAWWSKDGYQIDPEPDVSWYDKRRDFAQMAVFGAADAILALTPSPEPVDRQHISDVILASEIGSVWELAQDFITAGTTPETCRFILSALRLRVMNRDARSDWREQAEMLAKMLRVSLDRLEILEGVQDYQKHPREVLEEALALFEAAPTPPTENGKEE